MVLWISIDGDDRLGAKIKTQKNPQGFPTKPQKIPRSKVSPPKKPHTEFLNLKNFQKALNDTTRKIKILEIESLFLFLDHTI